MLTAQVQDATVEASYALVKPCDPRCPECSGAVVFKRGTGRVTPHFAHKPGVPVCAFGEGETPAHRRTKRLIVDWLRSQGHIAHLEQVVGTKPYRRADVLDETKQRVFEVQFSQVDYYNVLARSEHYAQHGLTTTWVFPWRSGGEEFGVHRFTRTPVLASFAPPRPRWMRQNPRRPSRSAFAFIDLETAPRLIHGSLESWKLYQEAREVFEAGGSSHEVGGHTYTSARWIGVRIVREASLIL